MDFLDNMNRVLDYIEDHLTSDIDYQALAEKALCSASNFQRFFTYVCGISLTEYIRRRRMSRAALELQHTDVKIADLAVIYGYESSKSFSRAFHAMHGVSPTEARKGKGIKTYPRLSFHLTIKGDTAMNYRILTKPAFRMIGIKAWICRKKAADPEYMPAFWRSHLEERITLAKLSSEGSRSIYGLTMDYGDEGFYYCLAVVSDRQAEPPMLELQIPQSQWAVFQCTGPLPDSQYDMWRRIFLEWLPFSGFTLSGLPEIEWYSDGDITAPDYGSTIWLPIRKASPL